MNSVHAPQFATPHRCLTDFRKYSFRTDKNVGRSGGLFPPYRHGEFTGRFRWLDRTKGEIEPIITGSAQVNGEAKLLLNEIDPFCWGIRT